MIRIVYMIIINLFYVPVWFWNIARMSRENDDHTVQQKYDYIAEVVKQVTCRGRVTVKVSGLENIPKENGFILFPNHQGFFDMLAIIGTCPNPLSVVIKKEAENWILIKQVIGATGSLAMDRKDIKDQVHVIGEVTKRVKEGRNFVIFAEGHLSPNGNELIEFKSGTFKSAVKAGCPIIPVALIDSFKPFGKNSLRREKVEVHYIEPICQEQYIGMKTAEIAHLVHDRIQEEINKNIEKKY